MYFETGLYHRGTDSKETFLRARSVFEIQAPVEDNRGSAPYG